RARANEQVHVCSYHPDLENPGTLLRSDASEKRAQEVGQPRVDQRHAIPRGPDDVAYRCDRSWGWNLGSAPATTTSFRAIPGPIHATLCRTETHPKGCRSWESRE